MPIKVTIDSGAGPVDYTQYIVSGSIKVEDNINTPTVVAFSVANINNAFNAPLINSYVRIFSTSLNKTLFSGFISSVPAPEFLGAGSNVPKFGFQRLVWAVNATSDEYLLNVKSVPFIPAFVNQTQGQILTAIASALAPGFFDTSNIAAGDLIPYYVYDPSKKWSDVAKELGDQSRMHHWALDKKLFFQPLGDAALAISYDETQPQTTFYPAVLQTNVSPIQPLNDAIVIGDVEPQNSWDNYFIGDGITNGFDTKHKLFRGASTVLLKDDWTETSFQKNSWSLVDPTTTMTLPGSLNVTNGSVFALGTSYLEALNGIELGGAVDLQHGEFSFNDTCTGIVGGVYSAVVPVQSNCLAGFFVGPAAFQQLATDTFNRANGALGANWTPQEGAFIITSNAIGCSAVGGDTRATVFWSASANLFPADHYSELTIITKPTNNLRVIGVAGRCSAVAETYYLFATDTATYYLQKVVAGVVTTLKSGPITPNNGDTLRLECRGTTLTGKINGAVIDTATDAAIASGQPGIIAFGVATIDPFADNWAAGTIGTTVVTVTASGASGLQIQPMLNGQLVGSAVPVRANHHYFLRTILTSRTFARYNKAYRTLAGAVFGNLPVSSTVDATFIIYDIDLAAFNLLPGGVVPIFVPPPVPSKQFFTENNWPSFGTYALINQNQLNLNVSSTILSLPPQGTLQVASLYGPTGTQLPISPIATNLLQFPNDFENAVWTKGTVTVAADAVLAPDGTLVADAVTANVGATDAVLVYQNLPVSTGQTYTLSVWLRVPAASGMILSLAIKNDFAGTTAASITGALTPIWRRFSVTATMGVLGNPVAAIGGSGSWTQGEVDIWGARLDVGSTIAASSGGSPVPYALGFGYGEQVATINTGQDSDILQFYTDTIPAVGARIRLQTWEPGKSIARVQNPVDIATEAKIVGDDGVRTFIYTNLQPLPRTSVDCEAAASALLSDYVKTQWDGQYEAHNHFWDSGSNLLLFSQVFSNPAWALVRATLVSNTTLAPDGTLTGSKLIEDTSAATNHVITQNVSIASGAVITVSVFAKAAERPALCLEAYGAAPFTSDSFTCRFDLARGTVGASTIFGSGRFLGASIQAVGNGWYRCSMTGTINPTNNAMTCQIDTAQNSAVGGELYTGTGASGVFFWGAQVQPGPQPPTTYILTTATAIVHDYPKTGRFFAVNTTQRGISGQQFLVRKVTTSILEMYDEILDFTIEFGQDTYIEKLLTKFVSRDQNVLTPKDSAFPPNLQFIQNIGQTYAPTLEKAQATFIDSSFVQIDLGVVPATGCEVRAVDSGWGSPKNRVGLFTTQQFQLNRTTLNQIWYLRQVNGAKISRQSKVIHVGYPLLPASPVVTQTDVSDFQLPKILFGFNGDIRNIYGIEIRDSDNVTVLQQKAVFSTADLLYTFDNTKRRVNQQTFFVYFFNLLWGYSTPLIFTLQCAALPSGGKNYLTNPGFEINNVGTTARTNQPINAAISDGWYIRTQNTGMQAILDNSASFPRSGVLCLEISALGTAGLTIPATTTLESRVGSTPPIPVRGGQVVYFGGYCRLDRNQAAPAGVATQARIGILIFDSTGTLLSEQVSGPDFATFDFAYHFNSGSYTLPLNAATVILELCCFVNNTNGSPTAIPNAGTVIDARFDDVFLIEQENLDQVPDGTRAAWDSGTQKTAAVDSAGNLLLKNIAVLTGTTPTPQQTSATYAVIPEMTKTITTKGNKVVIVFTASISTTSNGAQGSGILSIFKDGVQVTPDFFVNTGGVTNCQTVGLAYIDTPTAASHTYDVRWKVGLAGQTIEVQGTARTLEVVELG